MLPFPRLLAAVSYLISGSAALAANWPAWRGPEGTGVTRETNLPLTWSATENVKWKIELPEPGNSTPIIWNDRIFLTQAVGERRTVMCLDRKDGRQLWQQGPTWSQPERTHKTNPYCAASPVTDGERVIAWFGSAGLWCWDLAGSEQWHLDLGKQDHEWGYGSSPVIDGDLCLLNFGPGPRSFLVAVNKRTGKEVWRFDVPPPAIQEGPGSGQNTAYTGSWSTPAILEINGQRELVVTLPGAIFSLDPATGRELWHCNGLNPLAYAQPLLVDGVVVGFGGYNGFAIGTKIGGAGDVTATHRLWQEKRNPQRIGSGVAVDGRIYIGSDPGIVQCLDAKTGHMVWQERPPVPGGRTQSWSSVVGSGDRLYLLTKASDTLVFRAAPKFELLAANSLNDGMTNASLAISDGDLFIRTHQHLWCISAVK
jgi:outer membrane protein assembly factor BamB